jgi:hypothetical protein
LKHYAFTNTTNFIRHWIRDVSRSLSSQSQIKKRDRADQNLTGLLLFLVRVRDFDEKLANFMAFEVGDRVLRSSQE